jgi:hypothetical protein
MSTLVPKASRASRKRWWQIHPPRSTTPVTKASIGIAFQGVASINTEEGHGQDGYVWIRYQERRLRSPILALQRVSPEEGHDHSYEGDVHTAKRPVLDAVLQGLRREKDSGGVPMSTDQLRALPANPGDQVQAQTRGTRHPSTIPWAGEPSKGGIWTERNTI